MWWNRNPSVFWGGLLVAVGVLLLLANTGVFNNLNWDYVWPILVILLGVWLIAVRIGPSASSGAADSAEPRAGITKARLEVSVGAARIDIRSAALGDQLYRVHVDHSGYAPEVRLDRSTGTVRISQRFDWWRGPRQLTIDGQLTDAIPWDLSCRTGSIRGTFDFSTAALAGFDCSTGASQIDLKLGAPKGVVPIRVQGGGLTVNVSRPSGAAIKVQASGGAISLHADGARQDALGTREWTSMGFEGASDRYELVVSGGAVGVTLNAA